MMDQESREQLRSNISTELDAVKANIQQLEENTKPISPDKALGRLTRMEGLNDKGVREAALNLAREKLYNLEQALSRADDSSFGVCIRSHQPIAIERLLALPEASRCVRCA